MSLQHILKNSSISGKEPLASQLANGELSINYHADGPFLCCKDTAGNVRRVAGVWVSATAPSTPFPGELWLDTSITPSQLRVYKDTTDHWVFAGQVNPATTTYAGVVQLATSGETQAGTNVTSAVTPASLQSKISDSTSTVSSTTIASSTAVKSVADTVSLALPKSGGTITGVLEIGNTGQLRFEGSSNDAFETTLAVENPTTTNTITLPNRTGTVITTGDTGTVTSTMIADGTIANVDINANAEIAVSKLADGGSRQLLQTDAAGTGVEWTSNVDIPGTLDVTGATTLDSTLSVPLGSAAAPSIKFAGDNSGIYSPGADQVAVSTGGAGRLFVDSSGRLLVGTSSSSGDSNLLQVRNDSSGFCFGVYRSADNSNPPRYVMYKSRGSSGSPAVVQSGDSIGDIEFKGYDGTNYLTSSRISTVVDGTPGANDMPGRLVFSTTADGSASPTERMRIDSSGRVGIGTSSPGTNFHVVGTSLFNGTQSALCNSTTGSYITFQHNGTSIGDIGTGNQIISGGTLSDFALSSRATGSVVFGINATERMRLTADGRLGIGTSSPGYALDVAAADATANTGYAARIRANTTAGAGALQFTDSAATAQYGLLVFGQNGVGTLQADGASSALIFSTNSTERLRIDSSGRVGIGTGSPAGVLDVASGLLLVDASADSVSIDGGFSVTGDATVGSLNSGQLAGMRNRIINGRFGIWQRGTTFNNVADNSYTADRWVVAFNGTGGTRNISFQIFPNGGLIAPGASGAYLRFNQSTAGTGGTYNVLMQRIEGVRAFEGETVTASFWARSTTGSITARVQLQQAFGTGGSPSSDVFTAATSFNLDSTWQKCVATINVPSTSGKTLGTNNNHWLGFLILLPLNATFTFDITDVQLEPGSVATPSERRPIASELALCQRYFYRPNISYLHQGYGSGGSSTFTQIHFPVSMRDVPNITAGWSSGTNAIASTISALSNYGANAQLNSSSTGDYAAIINWTSFNAEL
jgi:hypothetical protein